MVDSVLRDSVRKLLIAAATEAPSAAKENDYTESNLPSWTYAVLRDGGWPARPDFRVTAVNKKGVEL